MRILALFLNAEIRTGGHVRYLELISGLGAKGHEVVAILNSRLDRVVPNALERRIPVDYVWGRTKFLGRRFKKAILRSIREDPILADWIVIFGETHWPAAKAISKERGIPVLYALRSDSIEESRSYLELESPSLIRALFLRADMLINRVRERDIARHAALIAFQTCRDRDNFINRNPSAAGRSVVIRGDIRQARFRAEYRGVNRSTSCRKLLFVGTLGTRKGLAYLLRALKALPAAERELVSLDILAVGRQWEPFAAIARETGMADRIRFHGKVANPLDYMRDADLLIAPSLFDSYPNTVLEALHVGLPVIGSRAGGIPDMLAREELLFEPASAESLASRLSPLIRSEDAYSEARRLCEQRRDYFDFDWPDAWLTAMNENVKIKPL